MLLALLHLLPLHFVRLLLVCVRLSLHLIVCSCLGPDCPSTSAAVKSLWPIRCRSSRYLLRCNSFVNRLKLTGFVPVACRPRSTYPAPLRMTSSSQHVPSWNLQGPLLLMVLWLTTLCRVPILGGVVPKTSLTMAELPNLHEWKVVRAPDGTWDQWPLPLCHISPLVFLDPLSHCSWCC